MSTNLKPHILDSFKNSVFGNLLKHSEGIYWIDLNAQTFTAIKSSPFLDSCLGKTGSYHDMFVAFFLAADSELAADAYGSFIQNGLSSNYIYTRRIQIHRDSQTINLNLTYYPEDGSESGYIVLTPLQNTLASESITEVRNKALAESYLYTMFVDLDKNQCIQPYVSELSFADSETMTLQFSEWRSKLTKSFPAEFLPLFLEKTNPSYIQKQLDSEKRYSFELQMRNLEGKIIWTRHSVIRILDEVNDHLMFIYAVQVIDKEKTQLLHQIKVLNMSPETIEPVQEPEPFIYEESDHQKEQRFSALSTVILDQVEKEIKEHYMDKLSLQQMANKYFINSAYLGQLFIRKHQMTFHEYLNSQRMNRAAYLLANTNYSIRQIIDMIGISSPHYFNRLFHVYFGCTPTFYRKTSK